MGRLLEREHHDAEVQVRAGAELGTRLSAKRSQLERVRGERGRATASEDFRRAAELEHRAQRIEAEIEHSQQGLNAARRLASDSEHARRATGRAYTREQAEERERFLDAQAALPPSANARRVGGGERRSYAALAGLAGYGPEEYEQLDPRAQRMARLEVDRELALRKELRLVRRMRDGGHDRTASRPERSALDSWRTEGRTDRGSVSAKESSVMHDAFEVAARRKRQLGRDQSH